MNFTTLLLGLLVIVAIGGLVLVAREARRTEEMCKEMLRNHRLDPDTEPGERKEP